MGKNPVKSQEKKYRVQSFAEVKRQLKKAGAESGKAISAIHYYAPQADNTVVKLVASGDTNEIHLLEESHGRFLLKEKIPTINKTAGLEWLKAKGYYELGIVKMKHTDYIYEEGTVGLYTINDFLYSVILDFPPDQHEIVEQKLGLEDAEVIAVPYNKYLAQLGRLKVVPLEAIHSIDLI